MNVPRYLDFQTVGCPWKTWAKGLESALSRSMRNSAAAHNLQPPYHLPTRHSFHCCHHGTQVASCQESQCDLLEQLVRFDPNKRPSACEALRHPYLDDLHDEDDARLASWGVGASWVHAAAASHRLPNSLGWARCFKSCGLELWWGNWSRWFAATWLPSKPWSWLKYGVNEEIFGVKVVGFETFAQSDRTGLWLWVCMHSCSIWSACQHFMDVLHLPEHSSSLLQYITPGGRSIEKLRQKRCLGSRRLPHNQGSSWDGWPCAILAILLVLGIGRLTRAEDNRWCSWRLLYIFLRHKLSR